MEILERRYGDKYDHVTIGPNGFAFDPVNRPEHYATLDPEPIVVIENWNLGFAIGQVVKYLARSGRKDPTKTIEDLKKARWYLDRHIANLENR